MRSAGCFQANYICEIRSKNSGKVTPAMHTATSPTMNVTMKNSEGLKGTNNPRTGFGEKGNKNEKNRTGIQCGYVGFSVSSDNCS